MNEVTVKIVMVNKRRSIVMFVKTSDLHFSWSKLFVYIYSKKKTRIFFSDNNIHHSFGYSQKHLLLFSKVPLRYQQQKKKPVCFVVLLQLLFFPFELICYKKSFIFLFFCKVCMFCSIADKEKIRHACTHI
jgi:hypothetical protein